uniref:Uncharacterized protein n=1 Tax=Parascaris univalens TaxID=6257 RepID=A0A915AUC8_PARUN
MEIAVVRTILRWCYVLKRMTLILNTKVAFKPAFKCSSFVLWTIHYISFPSISETDLLETVFLVTLAVKAETGI